MGPVKDTLVKSALIYIKLRIQLYCLVTIIDELFIEHSGELTNDGKQNQDKKISPAFSNVTVKTTSTLSNIASLIQQLSFRLKTSISQTKHLHVTIHK